VLDVPAREQSQAMFVREVEKDRFRGPVVKSLKQLKQLVKEAFLQAFTRCFRDTYSGPPDASHIARQSVHVTAQALKGLSLNDDATVAFHEVESLYATNRDDLIRQLAPQIELRFSETPRIMCLMYMAEVNLGMQTGVIVSERMERAVAFWDDVRGRNLFAPFSLDYNQGNALGLLKRYGDAIKKYESTLSQQPDFAPCWKNLGTAYIDVGNRESAKHAFQQAISHEPHLFEARYSLAMLAIEDQSYSDALTHLLEINVHELHSIQQSWVFGWLASVQEHIGDHREAIRAIESAIAAAPGDEWPWLWGGRIHAIARREDRKLLDVARAFGERLVSRFPEQGEAWGELGYTYLQLRHDQPDFNLSRKCVFALSKAIDLNFLDDGLIPDRLGHVFMDNGDFSQAEAAFRLASAQDGPSFGYCLGISLIELERYAEALPLLTAAAQKDQPDAMSWGGVALCHDRLGKRKKAIQCYERAIKIDPAYAVGWFNLGGMHWNEGNKKKAVAVWREALALFPDHELAKNVRSILQAFID
jgi:tetratricopeptide (TPR) repeat protein